MKKIANSRCKAFRSSYYPAVKYGIIRLIMVKKTSKKAQAEQAEKKKLIALFVSLFLLLFAATQLGVIGVTLYNLIRIMIGSLAYLLIIGIVFCIIRSFFKNKEQSQQGRLILGLTLIGISVLLSFQAYFDKVIGTQQTWHVVSSQLVKLKVTEFAGSGMIGHFIYSPLKLLFSVIGVYIIAALLLLIGLYVLTPKLWQDRK